MSEFDVVQEYVAAAQRLTRIDDLKDTTESAVRALGFDYFAILHHLDLELAPDGLVRFGNYPAGFKEAVQAKRYVSDDPVLLASQKLVRGFLWSEVPGMMKLSARQKEIIALGAREGLGDGYTVPVHIPGEFMGSSSFGVRVGKQVPKTTLPMLNYLSSYAFEAARRLAKLQSVRDRALREKSAKLTDRQLDCIVLAGRGFTARRAASALGLKQDTVQKHLEEAKNRLSVRTTTELVVRSLFDGRVTFNDLLSGKTEDPPEISE